MDRRVKPGDDGEVGSKRKKSTDFLFSWSEECAALGA
jgi:hypothetical protein